MNLLQVSVSIMSLVLISRTCLYTIVHNICSADKLSDFKKLRGGVYFVDNLPITPSGKCLKRIVQEMAIKFYHKENQMLGR